MFSLLRFWKTSPRQPAARPTPARRRSRTRFSPCLEPLEDRLVPALHVWQGAYSEFWDDPRNWKQGGSPYGDSDAELLFPATDVARFHSTHNIVTEPLAVHSIVIEGDGYGLDGGLLEVQFIGNLHGSNTIAFASLTILHGFVGQSGGTTYEDLTVPGFELDDGTLDVRSPIAERTVLDQAPRSVLLFRPGTLKLSSNNAFTAPHLIMDETTVIVGSNTALGSVPLVLNNGSTLVSSTAVTLANRLEVGAGGATIGGSSDLALSGDCHIQDGETLTVANTARTVSFNGILFGPGSLVKSGAGQLTLRGVNTYEGGTAIQGGSVLVERDTSLGRGPLQLNGGMLAKDASATVTVANTFAVSGGTIHNAGTLPFTFTGPGTLAAGGTLTVFNNVGEGDAFPAEVVFSGPLTGEGSLTKIGLGT